jgi:hypothetical protein
MIAFAGFFITELIKNVIHTTISGIFGSYYVPPSLLLSLGLGADGSMDIIHPVEFLDMRRHLHSVDV